MTLEGAMEGKEKVLSSSYMRVADGVTDPDGRAIVLWDFREEAWDLSDDELLMALFYQWHVVLSSESSQKRGLVNSVVYLNSVFDERQSLWRRLTPFGEAFPLHLAAYHFVKPPFFINIVLKLVKLFLGPDLRNRLTSIPDRRRQF